MSVIMAYLHSEQVSHSFMDSVLRVNDYQRASGGPVPERSAYRCAPTEIPHMRNVAMEWLAISGAEWLWMVDTDMGFREDTLEQLLLQADANSRPVVGALCYGLFQGMSDGMGGYSARAIPTLYEWDDRNYVMPYDEKWEVPKNELVKVDATGAACILIHHSVAVNMYNRYDRNWFTPIEPFGEDISFCHRLAEIDVPLYVHTGIPTTHHKYIYLGGNQ